MLACVSVKLANILMAANAWIWPAGNRNATLQFCIAIFANIHFFDFQPMEWDVFNSARQVERSRDLFWFESAPSYDMFRCRNSISTRSVFWWRRWNQNCWRNAGSFCCCTAVMVSMSMIRTVILRLTFIRVVHTLQRFCVTMTCFASGKKLPLPIRLPCTTLRCSVEGLCCHEIQNVQSY